MELKTDSLNTISVLFVEDDEFILEIQSSFLAKKFPGVVFHTAVNGRLGLDLFKAHSPDIVVTDINMTEMCGVQMSENIRAIKPATKFIAITGKSDHSDEQGRFFLHGPDGKTVEFDHVIVKPVDLAELCEVIEQFIGEIEK